MFENADARDQVEAFVNSSLCDVIINYVEVTIHHPTRPIVNDVVGRCHDESAGTHQMRKSSPASSNIQHRLRIDFCKLSEYKREFNWTLVDSEE
ncbi:hypothetical protein CA13_26130 [Planctomycetes bacterium CA13]|uniref:Uncharacterized protein n=1 Tax=Novipirellula herctigrandis TaxID=2527986 RepID=A0A5C5Z1N8_9BACT|nr:hypothetical protein CA13_26130 [Planctomycetes bacterium CA13]